MIHFGLPLSHKPNVYKCHHKYFESHITPGMYEYMYTHLLPCHPHSLSNIGNSCYMNAILQSLLSLDCFSEDMSDPAIQKYTKPKSLYQYVCACMQYAYVHIYVCACTSHAHTQAHTHTHAHTSTHTQHKHTHTHTVHVPQCL